MVLLHILLAVAFGLLWYLQWSLGKLQKAFETQGRINEVQKEAYDALVEAMGNTFDKIEAELEKKSNKRSKK